jgi:hypothetical protein
MFRPYPLSQNHRVDKEGNVLAIGRFIIMKPYYDKDGYATLSLKINDIPSLHRINRMVLMTWDRMPQPGEEAAHLNNDRSDNRLENLKWMSCKENQNMRELFGTDNKGEKNYSAKLTQEIVNMIRKDYTFGLSYRQLVNKYDISKTQISRIITGKSWK